MKIIHPETVIDMAKNTSISHCGAEKRLKRPASDVLLFSVCLFGLILYLFPVAGSSAEVPLNISADKLEHSSERDIYSASGSVKLIYGDAVLIADDIEFNNTTTDATASGSVIYEDAEVIINAERIDMNLNLKLGTMYNSDIFYKQRNYHIRNIDKLQKLGEMTYYIDKAEVTSCDAIPPEWRFRAEDININVDENIKARNATFFIKNLPVLYSPYFVAPLNKKRQTGFLTPSPGYSSTKGITVKQGFFWAINDNMDATFYGDYFSEKGFGKGVDFRYIKDSKTNGELWIYHLNDDYLKRDFSEVKSYHNQELPYDMSGYLKLHLVNEFDYYDALSSTSSGRFGLDAWKTDPTGLTLEERLQKYLESNLQISKSFTQGRTYFLGQYRQSLEGSSGAVPQSLPELGFIINTTGRGIASANMSLTGTNFWTKNEQRGQRIDVYPNFYLSAGRIVNFTQKIGLRETFYILDRPDDTSSREIFDLRSIISTRFLKKYPLFVHIIEPTVEYVHIPSVDHSDIPVFDSIDSMPNTSDIVYSLTNRLSGAFLGNSEGRLRLSQGYSLLDIEKPYTPVLIESNLISDSLQFSIN
ncbi:MAG TPA: LPS-assembly protein LptD, partial [Nitrospirae bacterium]|nr:LPS-assembly protein LptD [Nitrospirota bacterium]